MNDSSSTPNSSSAGLRTCHGQKLSHAQPTPSCFGLQRMRVLPTCWDICCGPFGCHKTTVATTQLGPATSPRPGARHQQRLRLAAANARRFADVAHCCRLLRRPLRLHRTWLAPSHPGSSSKRRTYPIIATPKACSTRSPCSLNMHDMHTGLQALCSHTFHTLGERPQEEPLKGRR